MNLFALRLTFVLSFLTSNSYAQDIWTLASPDQNIEVRVLNDQLRLQYEIDVAQKPLIKSSALGFTFKNMPDWHDGLVITAIEREESDNTWEQVWGETRYVRDHYNGLSITAKEINSPWRIVRLHFRAYNDGVAFRYEFPEQVALEKFTLLGELTEFNLFGDKDAWWIPAFTKKRYELLYSKTPLSQMPAAHTPVTIEATPDLFLVIHEANLTDFASMTLVGGVNGQLTSKLVPWKNGDAVRGQAPMFSPWRTLQIARTPAALLESNMIINLNEPNKLGDTSWIKPQKYLGIWWGMHIRSMTWGSGPKHGATTARTKEYIDYASKLGIQGLLIEGWNVGWDGDWEQNGSKFHFTEAYPDFDLQELSQYAHAKGVNLIGHHETATGISNYEAQMEDSFALYRRLGIRTVKTGYVGSKVEGDEWHHGQFMVRHFRKVAEAAARHGLMLDIHEPIKDTGLRRTYPNIMSREGARGVEYDAWSADGGNPPSHHTIIPFTRGMSGPFDFTPGIFDMLTTANPEINKVRTTLAKQLALYVTIYSPLHMAADLPANYVGHPAFKFIQDVPTDWDKTIGVNGVIGDYVTVARKDRDSDDWYLGAVTDEQSRELTIKLKFLDEGNYRAEIYRDRVDSHYETKGAAFEIITQTVTADDTLKLWLAPGGGQAIRFVK